MNCSACNKTIPPTQKSLRDDKTYYHFDCVNCNKCNLPMKGYVKFKDHKFFHGDCFKCVECKKLCEPKLSRITPDGLKCFACFILCVICGKNNTDFKFVNNNLTHIIHKECFKCVKCGEKDGLGFKNGKLRHKRCSAKKCVICSETVGENMIQALGVDLHKTCVKFEKCYCGHIKYPLEKLLHSHWTVKSHLQFPKEIQDSVFTLFMIWNFSKTFSKFPKDMIHMLSRYIATPKGWDTINGESIYGICTTTRCKSYLNCLNCDRLFSPFSNVQSCTIERCLYYKYWCENCDTQIPHDAPDETSCTSYRCIDRKCYLCKGEVLYGMVDNRELCAIHDCLTYEDKCICGNLIRHKALDPMDECTIYRCLSHSCSQCGLIMAPYLDDSRGCTKNKCLSLEKERENLAKFLDEGLEVKEMKLDFRQRSQQYRLAFSNMLSSNVEPSELLLISNALERWSKL